MRLYLVSLSLSLSFSSLASTERVHQHEAFVHVLSSSSSSSFLFCWSVPGGSFFFNRVFSSGSYGVYRVSYRIFCGIQSQFLRGLRPSSFFFSCRPRIFVVRFVQFYGFFFGAVPSCCCCCCHGFTEVCALSGHLVATWCAVA